MCGAGTAVIPAALSPTPVSTADSGTDQTVATPAVRPLALRCTYVYRLQDVLHSEQNFNRHKYVQTQTYLF